MTETKRKPGRPASDDPRIAVTLRLKRSVVDAYRARGEDWRGAMETALAEAIAPPEPQQVGPVPVAFNLQVGPAVRKPGELMKKGSKK